MSQALVLAGGEGTRLRPLTLTRPKPALPLVDRPFVRYTIDWLARHGIEEVVIACGFRADDVRGALGDGDSGGPAIRYLEEREPLGTAGPLRLAADAGMLGDRFVVLNGDVLTDLDLSRHIAAHDERGAVASLALHPVEDPSAYGLVRTAADGAVTGFLEKPDPAEIDTDEVNAGAYVLERSILDLIPPGRATSIEREVFPQLVGRGLYGLRLDGYWMDIGTPERYLQASCDILERRVATDVPLDEDGLAIDDLATIEPDAHLEAPLYVGPGARIGAGAVVGPCSVVGPDCELEDEAIVRGSILHDGCSVGAKATVQSAILGAGAAVGAGAVLPSGSVVGDEARVEPRTELDADARVEPGGVVA